VEFRQIQRRPVPEIGDSIAVAVPDLRIKPLPRNFRSSYPTWAGVASCGSAPNCSIRTVRNSALENALKLNSECEVHRAKRRREGISGIMSVMILTIAFPRLLSSFAQCSSRSLKDSPP